MNALRHERLAPRDEARTARPARRKGPVFRIGMLVGLGAAAVVALAAWIAGEPEFGVPIAILLALAVGFVLTHRAVGAVKARRYGPEGAKRVTAESSADVLPHLEFDDQTPVGDTEQHADPTRATGRR